MSIEAKALFMRKLEETLRAEITAADMAKVMRHVADQLNGFSLEEIEAGEAREDELLRAYTSALSVQGRSDQTVKRYEYIIKKMIEGVKTPTRDITVYHLRDWLAREKERGVKDSTLEGTRQIIHAYFTWLHRESLIERNPAVNLGAIKCKKQIRDTFTDVEVEKLKMAAGTLRDRALIYFLMATACRVNEVVQLDLNDLDLDAMECRVLGKGNKERTVFIDNVTAMVMKKYLKTRNDSCQALFCHLNGQPQRLTTGEIRAVLKKIGERANVENVHPHRFRRTKATELIRHGMPIQEVASILGHEKLDTTMKYVVLDKNSMKNKYQVYA